MGQFGCVGQFGRVVTVRVCRTIHVGQKRADMRREPRGAKEVGVTEVFLCEPTKIIFKE